MPKISARSPELKKIFEALRVLNQEYGYICRPNYMCCSSCATSFFDTLEHLEIEDDTPIVFWHNQDHEAFTRGGKLTRPLNLRW